MRRVTFVVLSVAALLVPAGTPLALQSALAASAGERVVAGFSQGSAQVVISAVGDPVNEAASGFVMNRLDGGTLFYAMHVTCMTIVGKGAALGGEITASDVFPGHVGSGLVFFVEDVAEPGRGADQAAHTLNVDPQPLPGTDCPAPTSFGPGFLIDAGNVQVFGG